MTKAVFLDRDGVLNEVKTKRVRFVNRPLDLHLLPGSAEGLRILRTQGYALYLVTNQGGIGLGFMKETSLIEVHIRLLKLLQAEGAALDDIAYCPHRPKAGCACRKPKPGMLLRLAEKHGIDLASSWTIGDMETDVAAGAAAGTRTIRIGKAGEETKADALAPSLLEAARQIAAAEKDGEADQETEGGQEEEEAGERDDGGS
ncbi:D-glycero-alpha-D-manno-heptose-1,7-bisphosphate 7-phosphatase [Paenibacillus sp. S-38]|uniref:D-glycero-alpha-D-manno-heptose-1,7-bisphosphate 7-phosphatase n=1 Tax=Paenibacillus sp. S-38 TaxID=3416710 RepID=UPI003CEF7D2C